MKLYDFIFCDDIRHEQNNKLSLMGLYSDRIIIQSNRMVSIKWPISIPLALLLRFQIDTKDEKPDGFELEYFINKKLIANVHGKINEAKIDIATFNLTVKNLGMPVEPGKLGFTVKLLKKNKFLYSETKEEAIEILHKAMEA
ncbi:MAG: hypothetical protein ABIH77_03705 [Pseudomonadota bacterium]|nr:hypothetical protein [Gammaproteobacteria bacterium]